MKSAVIGYGVVGKIHCEIISEIGELSAVCDLSVTELKNAQKLYKDTAFYTDYKKMIEEIKPDVVHICTPHYLHADMSVFALERGCNVLVEKPMCIRTEEIARIRKAVKASKKHFGVCHQNRYNGSSLFAKEYLKDKKILSAFATVVWNRDEMYYRSAAWRGKWATEGGGVLINQALHTLDLLIWFTGMPEHITATIGNYHLNGITEVEDTASILFEGGVCPVCFYATTAAAFDFPVAVNLRVDGKTITVLPTEVWEDGKLLYRDEILKTYFKGCYGHGHKGLISNFYDCIESGTSFEIDCEVASQVVKTVIAAYQSNGKRIKV